MIALASVAGLVLAAMAPALAASTQPLRILAEGDSTTAGTPFFASPLEAPPEGRGDATAPYPYWLARAHAGWVVVNSGVAGQRTDEIRSRFERDVEAAAPRYVILLAGVNDVYQRRDLREVEGDLLWMYRRAKEKKCTPIAASILPFTNATPMQNRAIAKLNRWIAAAAKAEKIPYCDLHRAVADAREPERLAGSHDGLHPDKAGYRAMADALAKLIESLK